MNFTIHPTLIKKFTKTAFQVSLLSIFFLFSNCADAQKKGKADPNAYQIKGKINGVLQQENIYLGELYQGAIKPIDTVAVNMKDSTFIFNGTTSESMMGYLILGQKTIVPFVLEPASKQDFTINLSEQGIYFDITGEKSENSQKIRKFLENNSKYEYELSGIENMFRSGQVSPMQATEVQQHYMTTQARMQQNQKDILKDHSNPVGAYFILNAFFQEPSMEDYQSVIDGFEKTEPKSKYLAEIKARLQSESSTMIGATAPEINLPSPTGENIALSSLKGKIVLIDFWASWCRPCRMENPNVKKVYDKYKDKGFEIYAVSLDRDKAGWEGAIKQDGLPWIHVSDLAYWGSVAAKTYKVSGIPYTVLLDKEGKILAKNLRGDELDKFLENIFK